MAVRTILFISQEPEAEQELFEWLLSLAQKERARLHILKVLPEIKTEILEWLRQNKPENSDREMVQQEHEKRAAWAKQAQESGVKLSVEVRFGSLFLQAIRSAREHGADFVVKRVDPQESKFGSHLFGSQDMHLLRKCPFPLLLHKGDEPLPFQSVMASLDVDLDGWPSRPLPVNQQIIDWSLRMADGNPWQVVHAWQADVENFIHHWSVSLSEAEMDELMKQSLSRRRIALESELAEVMNRSGSPIVHLCEGGADVAIVSKAAQEAVDLLVMGTLGRCGLSGFLIGNTAEDVLEQIHCSVLAVKPAGFKSPVLEE